MRAGNKCSKTQVSNRSASDHPSTPSPARPAKPKHDRSRCTATPSSPAAPDKDSVHIATNGYAEGISVPGAPSISDLHAEYIERGGRFYACPVCVKSRGLEDAEWVQGAEVKGVPSLLEFTQGGALTFNY